MDTLIKEALHLIFNRQYDLKTPTNSVKHLLSSSELLHVGKDKTIIFQNDPVDYMYVLIKGRVSVVNSVSWGYERIIDYIEALQIIGLVESLNNLDVYGAYVITETPCTFIRIAVERYIRIIQSDAILCYHTLVLMGETSMSNMNTAELKSLIHPMDMLGHHLFHLALSNGLPYVFPKTRVMLAEELHMNLRTLYRYLRHLEQSGYITIVHGKITIDKHTFNAMATRYEEVVL